MIESNDVHDSHFAKPCSFRTTVQLQISIIPVLDQHYAKKPVALVVKDGTNAVHFNNLV